MKMITIISPYQLENILFLTMAEYCLHCQKLPKDNIHSIHHDSVYGMPIIDDNELFGRLLLEINQAGLSWDTILKKKKIFEEPILILI